MWDVGKYKFDNTAENNPGKLLRRFSDELEWKKEHINSVAPSGGIVGDFFFFLLLFVCVFSWIFKSLAFECVS